MTERTEPSQTSSSEQKSIEELFQTAALILGDQEEAMLTLERAVAQTDADPCAAPEEAFLQARKLVTEIAVSRMILKFRTAFVEEAERPATASCLDMDDLSASGVQPAHLQEVIAGGQSSNLRTWLEQLSPASRVIFVLRAVLGKDNDTVANTLRQSVDDARWNAERVSATFRGALCSLTNTLMHTPVAA